MKNNVCFKNSAFLMQKKRRLLTFNQKNYCHKKAPFSNILRKGAAENSSELRRTVDYFEKINTKFWI